MTHSKPRYALLDTLRGITLCSMILYHACWDLVFLFGMPWRWYTGPAAFYWQQSICWTFILLSGFCFPLGHSGLRRGAQVFLGGAAVTAVTLLFSYDSRVIFGVLTFLGAAMMLTAVLDDILQRTPPWLGLAVSGVLFAVVRWINDGYVQFFACKAVLPVGLYRGWLGTFLGFMAPGFYSSDYFSLLPWLFLFWCGYFLHRVFEKADWLKHFSELKCPPLEWVGRHSLIIYLLHQPAIYGILFILKILF